MLQTDRFYAEQMMHWGSLVPPTRTFTLTIRSAGVLSVFVAYYIHSTLFVIQ